jgi:hypothetical protein
MRQKHRFFYVFLMMVLSLAFLFACDQIAVTSITVSGDEEVAVGDEATYTAVILPTEAQSRTVTWSVEETGGEATITTDGVLTGVAPGTVTVVATVGSAEGTFEVLITQDVESVTVSGPDVVMMDDTGTYTFDVVPATAPVETSSWLVLAGTGSATIDNDGILTPVTAGTVTVRATVNGVIGTKEVTLKVPVASVSIVGPLEVRLEQEPTYTTDIQPPEADPEEEVWSVVDGTGSATITAEGVFTPVTAGTVTLKVEVGDVFDEIIIDIIISVDSVEVVGPESILPSENPTYTAEILPIDATHQDVEWAVVDGTGSATIDDQGVLTPVNSGSVMVTATADFVQGQLEVDIQEDDRLLGTPRPSHVLATPENTVYVDGMWEPEGDVTGLDIVFDRQVYDVMFTAEASRSAQGVVFYIPSDVDLSRMQYFGIKMTGSTETPGVNPTVAVHMYDMTTGLSLYNDQNTEIELTDDNQWIVFQVSNRYRLQTENRDLAIVVDPHFTASGNAGTVTMQQVVFFGDAAPVTEPELLTPLKNAHWEATPVITAQAAVDEIDGIMTDVVHVQASAEAVSGWRALPAYVLEDISRKTTITFKVKLLTPDLPSDPKLLVTLGDSDIVNKTITRPAEGVDPVYQTVTVAIPDAMRTEANMWAARYVQIKTNSGGNLAVEYYIYDFDLTGDADPEPIIATRTNLGGDNVPLSGSINYVENGVAAQVPAAEDPAPVLFQPNDNQTLSKLEFGYSKTTENAAARAGMNGVYVRIQGTPGIDINLQQGWGDGWADESQRRFVLDGTVQEIFIIATNRSSITTGTGWFPFQFNATMPTDDMTDVEIKIWEFAFTAILPEEEPIADKDIMFKGFMEGGNTIVGETDTMVVTYDIDGNAIATVNEDNAANHVVAIANDADIRHMNQLTIMIKGEIGTSVTIKLAYGNMFNYDEDYVHTFTTDQMETIVIDIIDRDALKTPKISLSLFFDMNGVVAPADFTVYGAHFSGVE